MSIDFAVRPVAAGDPVFAGDRQSGRTRHSAYVQAAFAVAGLVALALLARQLRGMELHAVADGLRWPWAVVAAAMAAASFLGAACNLIGFAPVALRLGPATAAQLAGTAAKLLTPAAIGTVAVNTRLVRRAGAGTQAALLCVVASQATQFVITIGFLLLITALPGSDMALPMLPAWLGWVVAGALLVTVVVPVISPAVCGRLSKFVNLLREVRPVVVEVLRSPRRCAAGVGGCVALTAALTGCLWACVHAFGAGLPLLDVMIVLLAGTALGSALPTPGGVGGVEAAMSAALVAVGLPVAVAIPTVLLYRLVTYWLAVPLGVAAAAWLRRRQAL